MFLHMLIPANESIDSNSHAGFNFKNTDEGVEDKLTNKKVFYEVGCKIFEINKIIK